MKSILAVTVAVLLCSSDTDATTFETDHNFSVVLPDDWVEAPSEVLRNVESGISELSGGANKQRYDYGYQLSSADAWFEHPYIFVQVNGNGRVPEGQLTQYEKVEAALRSSVEEASESFGAVLSETKPGETIYDEREHVLWSTFTTNVQGIGAVNGLAAVKLTEFGFIRLMGYSTEDTYEKYSPIFRQAVHTLVIPDEYQYRPRLTDHAPTVWGINLGQSAIAGLVSGLLGGVVALIGYLKKKRSRRDG